MVMPINKWGECGWIALWCGLGLAPNGTRVLWLCVRGRAELGGVWKGLVIYGLWFEPLLAPLAH